MKKSKGSSYIPEKVSHLKIGIITSRFNPDITGMLEEECIRTLLQHGLRKEQIVQHTVPGALELPISAQFVARTQKPHAIICIGTVIQGDTPHFDYVCQETTRGLMTVSLDAQIPIIMGVLTTLTIEQAEERSNPKKMNKGKEFAEGALEMSCLCHD